MPAKKQKNRQRIATKCQNRWQARTKFRNLAAEPEGNQQQPIVQRGLVVIKLAVQGGRDVLSRQFHLQCHQRPDALVVDHGHQAQVDQKGGDQQADAKQAKCD